MTALEKQRWIGGGENWNISKIPPFKKYNHSDRLPSSRIYLLIAYSGKNWSVDKVFVIMIQKLNNYLWVKPCGIET